MAVERMRTCENVVELARELEVRPRCLYKWRAKLEALEPGEESARPSTHAATYRKPPDRLSHFEVDLPASNSGRDLPSPRVRGTSIPLYPDTRSDRTVAAPVARRDRRER